MSTDRSIDAIVRPAREADLPAIGRLGALLMKEHHEFDPRRFLAVGERTADYYAKFLGSQIDVQNAILLVADSGGQVVGYAYAGLEGHDYMSLRGPAAVLHDLVVEPDARGRGAGRLLLQTIASQLKARGAPRLILWTAERNLSAQRRFERLGFRPTMIEMTCELAGDAVASE
jgi:GNAT superfamily N-acetyltransferase